MLFKSYLKQSEHALHVTGLHIEYSPAEAVLTLYVDVINQDLSCL